MELLIAALALIVLGVAAFAMACRRYYTIARARLRIDAEQHLAAVRLQWVASQALLRMLREARSAGPAGHRDDANRRP